MFLGTHPVRCIWHCFTQEQRCRDPQQSFQCGCTPAKSDVAEETGSRVKNAFIPQKSHDLVTTWDKLQIFSYVWLRPAFDRKAPCSCVKQILVKKHPKVHVAHHGTEQPASGRRRMGQSLMQNIYVLWTYLCGHISPCRWAALGILSIVANRKGGSHLTPPPTSLQALENLDR